jgi:tetratricopeptide (TPR) repeat protein
MELLYNPDSMREEEIKATFVGRHDLIEELVSLISHQPDGPGVQHVVIIAPRGMGKTTALLMAQFAVREGELAESWYPVRFAEESYGVYDLSDLWIEALTRLAASTGDLGLLKRAEELKGRYPDSDDLREAALALIKDWRGENQKRLILLIDNFDMILEQINDELDNARLRDVLMNDGTMMLIGAATTFFREARAYDQPLYNFFKIYNLRDLNFEQMKDLLRRRAEVDRVPDFEAKLKANEGRLRVLEYFTGGNPRLVLMLYRVVTQSDISEVRRALEKLLDEVTPYYKSKVESLPAQQRKILEHIARVSSETREGVTPSQIAEATRLKPNQVSAQLMRLSELGYVRAASLRQRNSFYTLSEPLYAIWHQMRFGREARKRMQWLIDFLKVWYDAAEMGTEDNRLAGVFREHLSAGRLPEARNALDHRRYIAEAMDDISARFRMLDSVICSYLELKDFDTLKREVLTPEVLANLSEQTLDSLRAAGCITEEAMLTAKASASSSAEARGHAEVAAAMDLGRKALSEGKAEEALRHFDRAISVNPNLPDAWIGRGFALSESGKFAEAAQSFERALAIEPSDANIWYVRGLTLGQLSKYEEALASFDRAIEIAPESPDYWSYRGRALWELGRYEEAVESLDRVLKVAPGNYQAWSNRGVLLRRAGRVEDALHSYERALEINPDDEHTWVNKGILLADMDRGEEAVASYSRSLKINPNNTVALKNCGAALFKMGRSEEALGYYDRALEVEADSSSTWLNRGNALAELGRYDEAVSSYDRVESEDSLLRSFAHLMKFQARLNQGNGEAANEEWKALLQFREHFEDEWWLSILTQVLIGTVAKGHLKLVQQLITESQLEEQLFPLARAIEFLQSGDEALIEKLSPEVRDVVEDVVAKLSGAVETGKAKPKVKARKPKAGSRGRTKKQLR